MNARRAFRVLLPARIAMPAEPPEGRVECLAGRCMGTSWQVLAVLDASQDTAALEAGVAARLEEIEACMSHFRPNSALRRFGRLGAGERLALRPDFARVVRAALAVAQASEGAFDPTLAGAIDAWGFGAAQHYGDAGFAPPLHGPATMPQAWQGLALDEAGQLLQPGGVGLNLSAIAKGYAVDAASAWLDAAGVPHHLVEVGGELRGAGMKPDLQPWWVALEQPIADCPLPATRIALHGLAVATSGDYRRAYRAGGHTLQHTIDPASGTPLADGPSSVSVIHPECMMADAWATALMVRGPVEGLALAEARGLAALLQWREPDGRWREAASRAFSALEGSRE